MIAGLLGQALTRFAAARLDQHQIIGIRVTAHVRNIGLVVRIRNEIVIAQAAGAGAGAGEDHAAGGAAGLQSIREPGVLDLQAVQPAGVGPVVPAEQKDDQYKEQIGANGWKMETGLAVEHKGAAIKVNIPTMADSTGQLNMMYRSPVKSATMCSVTV